MATPCTTSAALLPWAETNQGLLSLLALAAALSVAVYENIRALRAENARRREYVDLAAGLVDQAIEGVTSGAVQIAGGHDAAEQVDVWNRRRERIFSTVQTIRPSVPSDAKLALAMAELEQRLKLNQAFLGIDQNASRQHFENMAADFRRVRKAISDRR